VGRLECSEVQGWKGYQESESPNELSELGKTSGIQSVRMSHPTKYIDFWGLKICRKRRTSDRRDEILACSLFYKG
jgi:hypothetical protein